MGGRRYSGETSVDVWIQDDLICGDQAAFANRWDVPPAKRWATTIHQRYG